LKNSVNEVIKSKFVTRMTVIREGFMLKSMTGYGKAQAVSEHGTFTVEVRSVNHRYGEISVRLPRQFMFAEHEIKRKVSTVLKRGKIDMSVQWEEAGGLNSAPQVDHGLARNYFDSFNKLAQELGLSQEIPLSVLLSQKGVLQDFCIQLDESELQPQLMKAVSLAVEAIDEMRLTEGKALAEDLVERRTQITDWASQIRERCPLAVSEYQQKLTARIELLLGNAELDPARVCQEVALMSDRCDITEELVRLSSHFSQFDETLQISEPVGRKLDFLMQEMNREVNTIGSKANDAMIAALVIQIKAEMEKMREQVQNVE
jgi:uncharacterized protein (TIGR00255 family)